MTTWQCYLRGWKGYVDFNGRASRKEYWVFILANILLSMLLGFTVALLLALAGSRSAAFYGSAVQTLFWLVFTIPSVAVGIRRMHDINRSGWWYGSLFFSSMLFKLLMAILLHFASPEVYVYAKLVLSVLLGWVPLLLVIYLCCQKSVAKEALAE